MGRHPCERCNSESWDYSEWSCPNAACQLANGCDICEDCLFVCNCAVCAKDGCEFCLPPHCEDCRLHMCAPVDATKTNKKRERDEFESDCVSKVTKRVFGLCGHEGCTVKANVEAEKCPKCQRNDAAQQRKQNLKDDVALLRDVVVPQLKSTEMREKMQKVIRKMGWRTQ
jgi:hypothetical protein